MAQKQLVGIPPQNIYKQLAKHVAEDKIVGFIQVGQRFRKDLAAEFNVNTENMLIAGLLPNQPALTQKTGIELVENMIRSGAIDVIYLDHDLVLLIENDKIKLSTFCLDEDLLTLRSLEGVLSVLEKIWEPYSEVHY